MNIQENYLQKIQYELTHTPAEYLPALLTIINSFRKSICINSAAESFSIGWQEMLQGQYEPINNLWDDIDK